MMRSLGLSHYTIRFIDVGSGVKNVLDLTDGELEHLRSLQTAYGISVSSIGSPIGKVKLLDEEDGTQNRYVDFDTYLNDDLQRTIDLAHALDTKLIRGFSYYPPRGDDPWKHVDKAAEQLARIVERCAWLWPCVWPRSGVGPGRAGWGYVDRALREGGQPEHVPYSGYWKPDRDGAFARQRLQTVHEDEAGYRLDPYQRGDGRNICGQAHTRHLP